MGGLRGLGFDLRNSDDRSAGEWRALRVAVTAGFYPCIAKVNRPVAEFTEGISGAVEKATEARKLRYFIQVDDSKAASSNGGNIEHNGVGRGSWANEMRGFLHPASLLFQETSYSCPWSCFLPNRFNRRGVTIRLG